jgi:predicted AAA+ superfamily ATPase
MGRVEYRERLADRYLAGLLTQLAAVMVTGPRASGKTTTASRHAATTIRLDDPADAAAFQASPGVALRGLPEPVLLDEWQEVPGVLGAVKRAVDADPRPARFILTGSVRAELNTVTWPGTGRITRLAMYPMTAGELLGTTPGVSFFDRLVSASSEPTTDDFGPGAATDLAGYVDWAQRGGLPEPALRLDGSARTDWWDGYVADLVTRDVASLAGGRNPIALRRYLTGIAANTAGVVTDMTLNEAAGIDRRTGRSYESLLTSLFAIDALPAWSSNRLARLVDLPKRFVIDPALALVLLGTDSGGAIRDGNLLGRTIETFVVAQLRAEAAVSTSRPHLFHLRDKGGRHEIDVIAEYPGGTLAAIEIKATSAPTIRDAAHLVWLRDQLGPRFTRGLVLHTGPRAFDLSDRVIAAPISTLWRAEQL